MVSKPRITLIVGAGFSCEAALPSTQTLSEQFLEPVPDGVVPIEVEQEISKHLDKFWREVFDYANDKPKPFLEDHFTAIDLAANTGHNLGPSYSPRKLRAIRRLSIHRVFQILDLRYRQSDSITSLLEELSNRADLSIVSVNWDVVMENHLNVLDVRYNYGPIVEPMFNAADRRKSGIPILKLHGSANWVYCDSCRTLFSGPPGGGKDALHLGAFLEAPDFELLDSPEEVVNLVHNLAIQRRKCRICGCQMSARVGTFSYRKDYAIQQFQTIWHNAFDALRKSAIWLFVGYSMPEADFEFRQVLKSAELANRGRLQRQIQVVLKDDTQATDRYRRFFGLNADSLDNKGFKDWFANSFHRWFGRVGN
jgi:hypothetical protein